MFFALVIVATAILLLLAGLRVVQQYQRALQFRLGRYIATRGPGLIWIAPIIDTATIVDVRVLTDSVEQQETIAKDNVPIKVNAVI